MTLDILAANGREIVPGYGFTPTSDGTHLTYTMTITDPATFTSLLELSARGSGVRTRPSSRTTVWRPDARGR